MTVEFIKTISEDHSGTAGEDASWSRTRVCRRGDGNYYRVVEQSTSSADWDEHKVWAFVSDKNGAKLIPRELAEPILSDVNWRCIADDAIVAAVAAL